MAPGGTNKFIISIVLPSILAIVLFILAFYLVLVPLFENNMMDRKKEMISELTNTAMSLVNEYYSEYSSGILSEKEAQELAANRVGEMRYGNDRKDYFWITDMRPFMILHPYRKELIGTDLSDYADPDGKKLFVESVKVVRERGEGFIDYKWQWKDDTTLIVPKLSYVKGFEEWHWIIGTGIYLEDVKQEMKLIKRNLFWISFIIILVIALALAYINRQSILIEKRRREAEQKLLLSRQKYKSLVEASSEGTLMISERSIIYVNQKFLDLSGYDRTEISEMKPERIFDLDWITITESFEDPGRSVSFETSLSCKDKSSLQVIISVSRVNHNNSFGYILIVKEPGKSDILEKEKDRLSHDMQTTILLMNQQISNLKTSFISCNSETAIAEAARLMKRKNKKVIFVQQDTQIIGVVGMSDLINRQLAGDIDPGSPVTTIMSAPVVWVFEDTLISEALLRCKTEGISHLLTKNRKGEITGQISYESLLETQQNFTGALKSEILEAESEDELAVIYARMITLVDTFIESGVKTESIAWVISNIADSINTRIIELSIENIGEPPCEFCFIVMGSQGRGEQTLVTDQDNGIILDDECGEINDANEYFIKLGSEINRGLNTVGYKYCKGNFMAGNPEWCLTKMKWKELFTGWINNSDPQDLLDISIFFDFRAVYGNSKLANELRDHINETARDKAVFYYHLSQSVTRHKAPVGLFGQIVGEHNSSDSNMVDIKKLLLPITGFARIYALRNRLPETNTPERLESLKNEEGMPAGFIDETIQAYRLLMNLRLSHQAKQIMRGDEPGNIIDVNKLTDIEQSTLRKVLSVINEIIVKLKSDFKGVL